MKCVQRAGMKSTRFAKAMDADAIAILSGPTRKITMIKTLYFNPFDYSDKPVKVGTIISLAWLPEHTRILGTRVVGFTTEIDVEIPDDGENIRPT